MIGTQTGGDFFCEPLIGYRTWSMTEDGQLAGVVYNTWIWPDEEDAAATCMRSVGPAPGQTKHQPSVVPVKVCNCGFYGYWDYPALQRYGQSAGLRGIRGVAIGWGKVWLCERGWRAKHARPVALLHWPERRAKVRMPFNVAEDAEAAFEWNEVETKVAERYCIPLVDTPAELEQVAERYLLPTS